MSPEAVAVEPVSPAPPPLRGPVLMGQRWVDLAFLHWAVPPERVQGWMPPGARPDVLAVPHVAGGAPRTYVALVPFRMVGAAVGRGPRVPWLGTFWETNVRLYSVDATGRRGVVFCSLDADRLAVVVGARASFGLPYRWARMRGDARVVDGRGELTWSARTRWPQPAGGAVTSDVAVRLGERLPADAPDAPLADFLTARWGLHTAHLGRTWYVPNEHPTWPLHRAEVTRLDDGLLGAAGFGDLARRPPDSVLATPGVPVRFGLPGAASRPRR